MNWNHWRVVTSKRFNVTLTELRKSWTILDVFEANCLLDSYDAAEAEAERMAEVERG